MVVVDLVHLKAVVWDFEDLVSECGSSTEGIPEDLQETVACYREQHEYMSRERPRSSMTKLVEKPISNGEEPDGMPRSSAACA